MSNRVTLTIAGQEYILRADASIAYMHEVAAVAQDTIARCCAKGNLPSSRDLTLAIVQIADELLQAKKERVRFEEENEILRTETKRLLEQTDAARRAHEQQSRNQDEALAKLASECNRWREKCASLKQDCAILQEEVEVLRENAGIAQPATDEASLSAEQEALAQALTTLVGTQSSPSAPPEPTCPAPQTQPPLPDAPASTESVPAAHDQQAAEQERSEQTPPVSAAAQPASLAPSTSAAAPSAPAAEQPAPVATQSAPVLSPSDIASYPAISKSAHVLDLMRHPERTREGRPYVDSPTVRDFQAALESMRVIDAVRNQSSEHSATHPAKRGHR